MSDVVIRTEKISKLYRIGEDGHGAFRYKSLRDVLSNPFRRKPSANGDTIWALKDVSFEVKQGEVVGIIGRNGAGKSTLLKILSRITEPTEGYAEIRGRVGSLLEVGTGFHPELTGRENIFLNGAILGMKKAEIAKKFDEIVAFAEVEKFIDTPVKHYSSGMYVRLAFAVAAHLEPEILLVDEVLAVGDAAFQKKCLGKMGDVAKEGRTVLFVSHNMSAVQELCGRALLVDGGRLCVDAGSRDVVAEYLATHADATGGDMSLSDVALRRSYAADSQFRWTRISILNSRNEVTSILQLGEPFTVCLQGMANRNLSDVRVGLSINAPLGVSLFNSMQVDNGLSDQMNAGIIKFRIRIDPNLLAPGLYEIGLGAVGPKVDDWLPSAMQFRVATAGGLRVWRNYHGGLLHFPCRWSSE